MLIAEDATPKEICKYLESICMLATSDMRRLDVYDCGDLIEIVEKKTQKPLFALIENY